MSDGDAHHNEDEKMAMTVSNMYLEHFYDAKNFHVISSSQTSPFKLWSVGQQHGHHLSTC